MRDPWDGDTIEVRRAIPWIVGIVFALVVLGLTRPGVLATIGFFAAVFVMIMLHEAGHFVTAKRAGMKVTEFFIGFGPRLWSVKKGETEYGVKAIPAGGYVRIVGMNNLEAVDPADEERTYRSKPFRHRLTVALAGSTVHFLLAFLLLFLALGPVGLPGQRPVISQVEQNLPAGKAGLQPGDRVLAINGVRVRHWNDVPKTVRKHKGKTLTFAMERGGKRFDVKLVPEKAVVDGVENVYIGVMPQLVTEHESLARSVGDAGIGVGKGIGTAIGALGHFFSPSGISRYVDNVTGKKSDPDRLQSVVGVGKMAGEARSFGEILLLLFAINMFVGVFNLIPLLPLDGGLVAIAIYEKIASTIRKRRVQVDVSRLLPITAFVFIALVLLGLSALYLDIAHPVSTPL